MKNKVVYKAKINKAATNLVMDMLDKLYDNPEAAVLREYVDNAYNANANTTKPVEVHLPEKKAPYLSIKDYGDGLNSTRIIDMFADFGTDKDKYLHSDLWSKTPFANQNYIERKMCCLSQCYYFDGYSFENKDLVTKAYSKYAGYMSGHIERDEALEIIDHINNTCASEIATLNQMLSDLDPLIK